MILDARCPNAREAPTGRWLRTMATFSSLLNITLKPGEILSMGGEDLKDFYYFFSVPRARAERNILVGKLNPQEARQFKCFREADSSARGYNAALRSMAWVT